MPLTLGQGGTENIKPLLGNSWAEAKAFWFHVFGYEPHANEVVDFHRSDARIKISSAPARTSKSYAGSFDVLPYGFPTDPLTDSLHWSVGHTYDTNKEFDYWYDTLVLGKDRLEAAGLRPQVTRARNNPQNGDMQIVIEWGRNKQGHTCRSVWKGMSSTNEKALQGEQVTSAILSEAAEHPSHILSKYLATRTRWIVLPTTPKPQAEWIKKMIQDGETDSKLGIDSWTFPPHANPNYNFEVFEQEKKIAEIRAKEMLGPYATAEDDPFFAEQFLGQWVYYTGKVLPFSRKRHVIDVDEDLIRGAEVFCSHDYGYRDPSVTLFWAIASTGELVIFDEIYERGLTTQQLVDKTKERIDKLPRFTYSTGDPRQPQVARLMSDAGLSVTDVNKNLQSSREAGTRRLVDLLVSGPYQEDGAVSRPGIYVSSKCTHTIHEFENLRYREGILDEYGSAALAGDDHAFDAARYGVMAMPTFHAEEEERDWIQEARYATSESYVNRHYFPEGPMSWQ